MSLIAATQLTAVATAVLALFALVTAVYAIRAFRKQSKEVGLLAEQATREADDRRRAQAAKVFLAVGGPTTPDLVRIFNSSDQPIYDLVASWADRMELRRPYLMPGEVEPFAAILPVDAATSVARLDFLDAAGLRWQTSSQGQLIGPLPG